MSLVFSLIFNVSRFQCFKLWMIDHWKQFLGIFIPCAMVRTVILFEKGNHLVRWSSSCKAILTYATNNNGTNGSTTTICLDKGDIYGEELVKWASNSVTSSSNLPVLTKVSLSDLPISTTTLKCYTKVEACTLMATDLKNIVQANKKDL